MKVRNTFYLPLELQARVDRLAKARNLSGTSIIEATIASVFSADADNRQETAFTHCFDQMSHQLQRFERATLILTDMTALFICFWLTATKPIAPPNIRPKPKRKATSTSTASP